MGEKSVNQTKQKMIQKESFSYVTVLCKILNAQMPVITNYHKFCELRKQIYPLLGQKKRIWVKNLGYPSLRFLMQK